MADQRLLRGITVATFLPAFGLCVAHGAVTSIPVPAVGLVPLAFSSGLGIFLLATGRRQHGKRKQLASPERTEDDGGESHHSHVASDLAHDGEDDDEPVTGTGFSHPILVFFFDVILAAGLMVVLVCTWVGTDAYNWRRAAGLAMLAAYATVPLLINFLIHAWLAIREFGIGVGLVGAIRYAFWHTIPPDCPHCGSRIRPDSLPPVPWARTVSAPKLPSLRQMSFSVPALSTAIAGVGSAPRGWKAPAWLKGTVHDEDAALLVNEEAGGSAEPYSDYDDDAVAVAPPPRSASPGLDAGLIEEVVVTKKDKKGKSAESLEEPSWSS